MKAIYNTNFELMPVNEKCLLLLKNNKKTFGIKKEIDEDWFQIIPYQVQVPANFVGDTIQLYFINDIVGWLSLKEDIFELKVKSENISIKEYLKELLLTLWEEKECFSGKRPFGNSDWEYEIYKTLIENKVINGKLDEDGYVDTVDTKHGDEIIKELIDILFETI